MANKIFISYSRQDEYFARSLAVDLEECSAEIWIDVEDIPVGSRWSSAIQEGLSESEVMLLIATPDSMASTNVEDEWNYFLDKKKPILIVYWRTCEAHFQLWRNPRIEFRQHKVGYHTALPNLIKELKNYGMHLQMPEKLPTLSDSFMRQALRRALSEAAKAEAESPFRDSERAFRFGIIRNDPPNLVTKPIKRRRANRRPLMIFIASVIMAILLVSSAVYVRFFSETSPSELFSGVVDAPTVTPSTIVTDDPSSPVVTPSSNAERSAPTITFPPLPPTIELRFNQETLYLRNLTNRTQDVSGLIFRQTDPTGTSYEFHASSWQTPSAERNIIYALGPGRCFQIGTRSQAAAIRPAACQWLDSWVSRGEQDFYFWLPQDEDTAYFIVYWQNRQVATCPIQQGYCEFNLDSFRD